MSIFMHGDIYDDSEGGNTADEYFKFINLPDNADKTFELISGHIVMMAGNASTNHQRICGYIARKIGNCLEGKNCEVFQDLNVYLFKEEMGKCKNVFQPDIMIGCDKDKFTDRGYEGTPEFIVEVISKSTARMDYLVKYKQYMQFGVKEYWIVDLAQDQIVVHLNGDDAININRYTFNDAVKVAVLDSVSVDFKEIVKIVQ